MLAALQAQQLTMQQLQQLRRTGDFSVSVPVTATATPVTQTTAVSSSIGYGLSKSDIVGSGRRLVQTDSRYGVSKADIVAALSGGAISSIVFIFHVV
jgi:hypothetical protein